MTALPGRYSKLAHALGGDLIHASAGSFVKVTTLFGLDYRHGFLTMADCLDRFPISLTAVDHRAADLALTPANLLFLDTETTGLGGAGTVAFLVGFGQVTAEGFVVTQLVIPDYPDEAAMLEDLLAVCTPETILVTYNGAAFDLPLLTDRFIMQRVGRSIPMADQLDLLHTARRLFKRRIRDCSLGNVEKQVLGFERREDLPGYLVPSVYFTWLSDESIELMPGVLEHNRLDIVSLLFFLAVVSRAFDSVGDSLDQVDDLYSLSRVYNRRRRLDHVLHVHRRLQPDQQPSLAAEIILFQAGALKRAGQVERAVPLWQRLLETDDRIGYWASLELSKYFEHTARDFAQSLACAERASRICPYGLSQQGLIARRIARLAAKLNPPS